MTDAADLLASRRAVLGASAAVAGLAGVDAAAAEAVRPLEPTVRREDITIDRFVGVNAFVDDPIDLLRHFGSVREYHTWAWDEGDVDGYAGYPDNEIRWAPSYAADGAWNFDEYYGALTDGDALATDESVTVAPCVQRAPGWLHDGVDGTHERVPVDEADADPTDPGSYEAKAHHAFQFAARYGLTEVDRDRLTLADDQPVESGLGLVRYYEDWNEPNRWWGHEDAQFDPEEYAAMSSAACDGHAGTLEGPTGTYGVKNADPETNYVMGGIAGHSLDWIRDVADWYAEHRPDGEFVPDVINVHHYCHSEGDSGPALSPEADDLRGRMAELADWRDEHHPEVELWVSEFGWDTHPDSVLRPPEVPGFTREELQGAFLLRAYLELAAAGVDRAQTYMLRDVDPDDPTQYSTCGLVSQKGEWEPKPAFYYVTALRYALRGLRFDGERDAGGEDVRAYAFADPRFASRTAYAVWSPTTEGRTVPDVELDLAADLPDDAAIDEIERVEPADGSIEGERTELSHSGGTVAVDATETPTFVRVAATLPGGCPEEAAESAAVDGRAVCDLNGDGAFRDVDADGEVGQRDVLVFFENQHRPAWKEPELFDFSGNGDVGHGDVVSLFEYVAL